MAEGPERTARPEKVRRAFNSTHWSLVRAAGGSESPETAVALEALCQIYWYPVYAHIRFLGRKPEDAQDLTQAFFARLLEKNSFRHADPERGRFRSFMLGSLKHFLRDAHAHDYAQKRGGGFTLVSWDKQATESRLATAVVDDDSPDRVFERRWAETMLDQAATKLRKEYKASGRGALFSAVQSHVTSGSEPIALAEAANQVGSTVSAMKSAALRLRRRYYELIRDEVAQTLADPTELDDELRHLLSVILPTPK